MAKSIHDVARERAKLGLSGASLVPPPKPKAVGPSTSSSVEALRDIIESHGVDFVLQQCIGICRHRLEGRTMVPEWIKYHHSASLGVIAKLLVECPTK